MIGNSEPLGHLSAEQLDRVAVNPATLDAEERIHLSTCRDCETGVEDIRVLLGALRGLAVLVPADGFADRVMARVRLPLPWRRRAVQAVREKRGASAAAFGALAALTAGAVIWIVRFPDLRPTVLASWVVNQAGDLLWQATMGLGRVAYAVGLTDLLGALAADLTVTSALAGLATIALVCLGSLTVMVRLVRDDRPALVRAR